MGRMDGIRFPECSAISPLTSMLYFTSMSTAEIIAELPRLTAEELAQVQAKLRELVETSRDVPRPPQIHSPRLARPEQSKDFIKQVVELAADAKL